MCKILVMKISFLIIWLFSFWYALTYAISLKKPKHFFKCTLVTKELLTPSKGETSLLLPRAWPYSFPATFQWKQILQNALSPNFIANFLKCLKNICMPCLEIKEQKNRYPWIHEISNPHRWVTSLIYFVLLKQNLYHIFTLNVFFLNKNRIVFIKNHLKHKKTKCKKLKLEKWKRHLMPGLKAMYWKGKQYMFQYLLKYPSIDIEHMVSCSWVFNVSL